MDYGKVCLFVLFSTVHIEWFRCHLHPLFPAKEKNPHFACAPFHQPLNLTYMHIGFFYFPIGSWLLFDFFTLFYFVWWLCWDLALGLSVDSLTVIEFLMQAARLWAVLLWDNYVVVRLFSNITCFGFFSWPMQPFVKCNHLVTHTAFALEFLKASLTLTYVVFSCISAAGTFPRNGLWGGTRCVSPTRTRV